MRKGMHRLALQVQQGLRRDPHAGDLYIFRGRAGGLVSSQRKALDLATRSRARCCKGWILAVF